VLNLETHSEKKYSPLLEKLSKELKGYSLQQVKDFFELADQSKIYKSTISVCEHCLEHNKAIIYQQDNKVWIKNNCIEHGFSINLIENDVSFYKLSNKDLWGKKYQQNNEFYIPEYSSCCGPSNSSCCAKPDNYTSQLLNKSCTVLVEVTNACNMACRVCYADAAGDKILAIDQFKQYILQLISDKNFIDSIQVTGGEATIHPQFWEMVRWLYDLDQIGKIYLPTNGLEISKKEVAESLKSMRDKILVLLQFDGIESKTNTSLRRANTLKIRERAIESLAKQKICMQLTMTVAQDLSEKEISWVMKQGLKHKHIRLIGFLPTFYTGRYQLAKDGKRRPTLSTVVHALAEAMPEKLNIKDFSPIPCSHPNCGWTTLFARRFGLLFNITQKIDLNAAMNEVAYKTILDKNEIHSVLGSGKKTWFGKILTNIGKKLIRPCDVFGIAIKPFMDQFNYDLDRVSNCCHHILSTEGQLVSFCEYNTRLRMHDSWENNLKIYGDHQKTALAIKQKLEIKSE
jgi:uncharacterized radical SAM superfamily Fe-S cluster-containing enzyme